MPPPRPVHKLLQSSIGELLHFVKDFDMVVMQEFPYKPSRQYQFWYADVAVIARAVWRDMATWRDYVAYAPELVVEVLSPSNRERKVERQRVASMAHGTREFWVVDAEKRVVSVTTSSGVQHFGMGDRIANILDLGRPVEVSSVFDGLTVG